MHRWRQWREWFLQYYGLALPCVHENVPPAEYWRPLPRCPRCGYRVDREGNVYP